jgi:hypothetical protein
MKGYMLILEVVFSLLLLFSLLALFLGRISYESATQKVSGLAERGEEALSILDERGLLNQRIYDNDFTGLNNDIRSAMPTNIAYNFLVYNSTSLANSTTNSIPTGITANIIYFLYGNKTLNLRRINLILWYLE